MNFVRRLLPVCLGAAVVAATTVSQAAIIVPSGGTTQTFAALPAATEWSTSTTALAGTSAAGILTTTDLDTAVANFAASSATAVLPQSPTNPPSQNIAARHNTTNLALQTRPTGNGYTALLATLQNGTGNTMTNLNVSYELTAATLNTAVGSVEEIPGQRVYYSTTGLAGSFTAIGTFGHLAPVAGSSVVNYNFNIPLSLPDGGSLYLLWADDNGSASDVNGENSYSFGSVSFTPTAIPEPSTFVALGLGAAGFGLTMLRRRRMAS